MVAYRSVKVVKSSKFSMYFEGRVDRICWWSIHAATPITVCTVFVVPKLYC